MAKNPPPTYSLFTLQRELLALTRELDAPPSLDLASKLLQLFNSTFVNKAPDPTPNPDQLLMLRYYGLALVIYATIQPGPATTASLPPDECLLVEKNKTAKPALFLLFRGFLGEGSTQILQFMLKEVQAERPTDKWAWLRLARRAIDSFSPDSASPGAPPPVPSAPHPLLAQLAALRTRWGEPRSRISLASRIQMLAKVAKLADQFAIAARAYAIYSEGPHAGDINTDLLLEQATDFVADCRAFIIAITGNQAKTIAGAVANTIERLLPTLELSPTSRSSEEGETMQENWLFEIQGALLAFHTCATKQVEATVLQHMRTALTLISKMITPRNKPLFERVDALRQQQVLSYYDRHGYTNEEERRRKQATHSLSLIATNAERRRAKLLVALPLQKVQAVVADSPRSCARALLPLVSVSGEQKDAPEG